MNSATNPETPSLSKLMSGDCPQTIYDNMKIILSRTTTSHALGELFILVDRIGFVLVRLKDIEYVAGNIQLTVISQETSATHIISHSLNDNVPKFTMIKLDDVLALAEKI